MTGSNSLTDYVESRWKYFHDEAKQGRIHANGIASLSGDVAQAIQRLREGRVSSPQEADDIVRADGQHQFHLDHFQLSMRQTEEVREYLRELARSADAEGAEFNRFVTQMLVYANGAAALGGLAYLGSKPDGHSNSGIVLAIIFFAVGFLAALLSAHLLVIVNWRIGGRYRGATFPSNTEDQIYSALSQKRNFFERFVPPAIGWVSVGALVSGAIVAFLSLN